MPARPPLLTEQYIESFVYQDGDGLSNGIGPTRSRTLHGTGALRLYSVHADRAADG